MPSDDAIALPAVPPPRGDAPVDLLLVVPWLKRGGADLATLLVTEAALRLRPDARILVATTIAAASPWVARLPRGVRHIDLAANVDEAADTEVAAYAGGGAGTLARLRELVRTSRPRTLHIMQSEIGWRLLREDGAALRHSARLFASVFLDLPLPGGTCFSFARSHLPATIAHLDRVFCDCQTYARHLNRKLGIPGDRLVPLLHPADGGGRPLPLPWRPTEGRPPRVLWASRLDRQKRPDILIEIAQRSPDICFDVYGEAVLGDEDTRTLFGSAPQNVVCRGPFDGLGTIDTSRYDCLLYTSEADGLPNILIEAAATALPVVAPAVGGIAELVTDDTGYLVSRHDDVDGHVAALRACLAHPQEARRRGLAASASVAQRHSWPRFIEALNQGDGYFRP